MSSAVLHPDVMTAAEAVRYLRFDQVAANEAAAERLLLGFVAAKKIHPLRWSKKHLYSKSDLDRFAAAEVAALTTTSEAAS